MANNKNSKNTTNAPREFFDLSGMKIANVRKIPGTEVVTFSLLGKGLGLYNLRIVKGARGEFIAEPSVKGKDGAFYKQYALYLSDDAAERVIGVVRDKLPAEEAPAASESDF